MCVVVIGVVAYTVSVSCIYGVASHRYYTVSLPIKKGLNQCR